MRQCKSHWIHTTVLILGESLLAIKLYVAVLGRNQILFCCVFRLHYCLKHCSTEVPLRADIHYIDLSGIDSPMLHIWAPPTTEVLCYRASNTVMLSKCAMFNFYCHISNYDVILTMPIHPFPKWRGKKGVGKCWKPGAVSASAEASTVVPAKNNNSSN